MKKWREIPVEKLALQLAGRKDLDVQHVLRQVEGWQKLHNKVPTWADIDELEYPHRLALEQCSGEPAARYKAHIVEKLLHTLDKGDHSYTDLTGGLGVDFSFIAPLFTQATYVERQEELCRLAKHNFPLLHLSKAQIVCTDAVEYLKQMSPVDVLFLDPARRDTTGRKTVMIEDCEPNICALHKLLLQKARYVVIKLSTMLDITGAVTALHPIQVHIVSVGGECKDLLLVLGRTEAEQNTCYEPQIVICEGNNEFCFTPSQEAEATPIYTDTLETYLYEPGAATLKAGAFKLVAQRFGLKKLHPNSHLYTSDQLKTDFPGRIFHIEQTLGFSKQDLRTLRTHLTKANLTIRNFPSSVDALRKKLKLREGGNDYLFATTLHNGSHALIISQKA